MRKRICLIAVIMALSVVLCACGKEEVKEGPVDEQLSAISVDQLENGHFYVKCNGQFYKLPAEDCNFNPDKDKLKSTENTMNGMVDLDRVVSFTWKDNAIPTLYKNDQLVYVTKEPISEFVWERYLDQGYSIGIGGLSVNDSGKVSSGESTRYAHSSSAESMMSAEGIDATSEFTIDAINGTRLGGSFMTDANTISGMSKDATANTDVYLGTQHKLITMLADTRYFKAFEVFKTESYSLSTDGYAVVEVPGYFKSGYYLINNMGFVKYLNIDRGVDESGLDFATPYYYLDDKGKTITYYEWADAQGIEIGMNEAKAVEQNREIDPEKAADKFSLDVDTMAERITFCIKYKYQSDAAEENAVNNGLFPRAYLVNTDGGISLLEQDEKRSDNKDNVDSYQYLAVSLNSVKPGTLYVIFNNFESITKSVEASIISGNATSYLHNKNNGEISIYYEKSELPHDFVITWENNDRRAGEVEVKSPSGVVYSMEETPGNIMMDEAGKFEIKVPCLESGKYKFSIRGDSLGRVWVDCIESVAFNSGPDSNAEETTDEADQQNIDSGTGAQDAS